MWHGHVPSWSATKCWDTCRYTQAGLKGGLASLKANDKAVVTLLQQVAAQGHITLHLATISKQETGGADGCGDDYDDYDMMGDAELIDADCTWHAGDWVCLDGSKPKLAKQEITPEAILQVGVHLCVRIWLG